MMRIERSENNEVKQICNSAQSDYFNTHKLDILAAFYNSEPEPPEPIE
jgi:predicted SAM-dependent methyltransferase